MHIAKKIVFFSLGASVLHGCGGSSNVANFTSWSDVGANETVRIDGEVKYAPYTADGLGAFTPGALMERSGRLAVTLDGVEMVEAASVDAEAGSVSFDEGNGDTINTGGGLIAMVSAGGEDSAIFADPDALGFNYQTFGSWLTGYGGSGGIIGAGSFGRPSRTRIGEVPTLGTATYEGGAGGVAIDATGVPFAVASEANVFVNFSGESFNFWTENTIVTNIDTAVQFAEPLLDLSGDGSIAGASLTGTVEAVADMSGPIDATFYGSNAPEVGGTFYLTGPAGEYMGAFGAVMVP